MNKIKFENFGQWLEAQEKVEEINQAIAENGEVFEEVIIENSYFDIK